ncbi:MAG: hypothetical protein HRF47_14915 [Chloroflexota bacterium]|jgi:hypothetical protein
MNKKKIALLLLGLGLMALALVACGTKSAETPPPPTPITVTKIVEVTKEVPVTVEPPDPAEQAMEWLPTSLHGTAAGKAYWYSKENGGMESLTGIPFDQLPCKSCHALYNKVEDKKGQPRCESCHINDKYAPVQAIVKLPQFPDDGRAQGCLSCHGRQRFEYGMTKARVDPNTGDPVLDPVTGQALTEPLITDVHRSPAPYGKGLGFTCVNCHGTGDTHGDGNSYNSLLESPNTQCTDCHAAEKLSDTPGHKIHGENMTCATCHAQTVVSCQGCHINGPISGLPEYPNARVIGWKFLIVNEEGKYDLGNVMAAAYTTDTGDVKSFVAIGPYYDHSISKPKTREEKIALCASCHASEVVKQYEETGLITISTWDEAAGKMVYPTKGVIPVVANYQETFKLAFPIITNMDEVVQAWKNGAPQAEVEKMTKWGLGKDTVDLWQMLFAKPLDKLPMQMLIEQIEAFFPAQ